jgi:hypothetical protein
MVMAINLGGLKATRTIAAISQVRHQQPPCDENHETLKKCHRFSLRKYKKSWIEVEHKNTRLCLFSPPLVRTL